MLPEFATASSFCSRLAITRIFPLAPLCRRPQYHCSSSHRTISSGLFPMTTEPLSPGTTLCAQSGRTYTIQEVLAERREPLLCVYRARYDPKLTLSADHALLILKSAEGRNFIVKNMIPGEYEYQQALQKPLASCPNLRTVVDGLPGPELFIYPFLQTDFLQFSQKNLTEATRKSMLKKALVGLAALHDRNIIHTGGSYSFLCRRCISR